MDGVGQISYGDGIPDRYRIHIRTLERDGINDIALFRDKPAATPNFRERLIALLMDCPLDPWTRDAAEARADEIIRGMGGE